MTAPATAFHCQPLHQATAYWREAVRSARTLALFLDFDGTLSPIVPKPGMAAIDQSIRNTLEQLKHLPGVQLAIISGRPLADVRARVGVEGIHYAGNHGLEIETDTVCFREPRAESLRLELKRLLLRLQLMLSDTPDVSIEEKGLSLAVHYRQLHESLHDWLSKTVSDTVSRSHVFHATLGKMVVDIRPRVEWNKGHAVKWLLERLPAPGLCAIYIGDDTTDEDAFAMLGGSALTIRVGQSALTSARFWVPDVNAVRAFLASVNEIRTQRR